MPQPTSVKQALEAFSESADPQKLTGLDATLLFDLSGEEGGQWTATIGESQLTVTEGSTSTPTVTLEMTSEDFVALVNGQLNPLAAFMQGRIKVKGDMSVAMRLQTLFS